MTTLGDIGEFAVLRDVVFPSLQRTVPSLGLGDDCAYVPLPGSGLDVVVTTDRVPRPLLSLLVKESFWTWGWFSVAINLSDLAAAGCTPVAFLSSVSSPSSMDVHQLEQFFVGISSCCREYSVISAGGNLSAGESFECHGTAIGAIPTGKGLRRRGSSPGDVIVAIGECGLVISSYLMARSHGLSSLNKEDRARLESPRVQVREMAILNSAGLITAASDNSDGLLSAVFNIVEASDCAAELFLEERLIPDLVRDVALGLTLNPWNLFFCWGDWQVVATVPAEKIQEFERCAVLNSIKYLQLGRIVAGSHTVTAVDQGVRRSMQILRNEHFRESSFGRAPDQNIENMLSSPLFFS